MPANEAKMAGVPVACTDYSALYEKNRNGGGIPIKVQAMYTECETMQNRALFDVKDLASTMAKVMGTPALRMRLGQEARQTAIKYYNRITSYNVCYTKLLRFLAVRSQL